MTSKPIRTMLILATTIATSLFLGAASHGQIGGKPNKVGRSAPATSPLEKLDPWKRRDIDRGGSEDDSARDDRVPRSVTAQASIVLGQRVKGRLEERGEVGAIRFTAPAGTKLRFSLACEGGVGASNVALLDQRGVVVAFARSGRRFELVNHVLDRGGEYQVRIVHDDAAPMAFVMSSSGEFPATAKEIVELRREAATAIFVEGFPGRSIIAVEVVPLAPRERVGVRWVFSDRFDEKLGSAEATARSATDPRVDLASPIEIAEIEPYRADVWLVTGRSPQQVELRMVFENPKPGIGTVELRKRS